MSPPVLSEDNFEREFEARLAIDRERRFSTVRSTARAWLALVPAWTNQLAIACEFPTGATSLSEFLQTARKAGLAEGSADGRFWMPEGTRSEILSELRKAQSGSRELVTTAAEIGQKILAAQEKGVPVSQMVSYWAALASHARQGLEEASGFLISTVDALLQTTTDTGGALDWLKAGKSLASSIGGPLESAIRVGEHRIELAYRKEQDERHLSHLLHREEQVAAFKYLMENQDGVWGLHYVGMGGVGKTMMLRQITARLAPEHKAATSRVDFDFLNPDYPVRLPGQLLLELAADLRAYITNPNQEYKYESFQAEAIALHESLSTAPAPEHSLANIHSSGFMRLLQMFCDFLHLLPGPKVLILDTCEELAKAQLSGGKLPVLDATFEIIEQICRSQPNIRIVFAGRRLLAQGGRNWRAAGSNNGKTYLPETKDYLALQEVLGFNENEARTFLRDTEELSLPDSLQQAIFSRSREAGVGGRIIRVPPRPVADEVRYNPFDLSLYAEWIKADPKLDAGVIASGQIDPYVENRIVHRIRNPHVQALLPSVVLLGRFNREMLIPAMAGNPDEFEEAFRELSDQEWIDHRRNESVEESFLEVNRNLYDRLYGYFAESSRKSAFDIAGEKLWPNLAKLVRELPLRKLSVDHVDAVFRLAPASEQAELWDQLNRRITNEENWNWAQQVASLILGEDGAIKNKSHPLRAAVLATQAVALFHQNFSIEQAPVWKEIGALAQLHPDKTIASWLSLRSKMKALAEFRFAAKPSEHWQAFRRWISDLGDVFEELSAYPEKETTNYHREQLIASFCATIEGCIENTPEETEWGLKAGDVISLELPGRIRELTSSTELVAFSFNLVGRALARKGRWGEAVQLLDRAEQLATKIERSSVAWEDWRAPTRFLERIRLDVLTTIPPRRRALPTERTGLWHEQAVAHLHDIDAERLVSLILQRSLAYGLIPKEELDELASRETYVLERRPVCAAHRAVAPLAVSLVIGWLGLGRGDIALDYLNQRLEAALHTRKDPDTVRLMENTKLHLIRRLRLRGIGTDIINRMMKSENEDDTVRVRELLALISSTDSEAFLAFDQWTSYSVLHGWWRGQVTFSASMATEPVEKIKSFGSRLMAQAEKFEGEIDARLAHFKIDWHEASILADNYAFAPLSKPRDFVFSADDWWANHATRTEEGLSLVARTSALRKQVDLPRKMINQVGPRLFAEMALEEGELLALRLPSEAAFLLDEAYKHFCEAKDYFGAFMAMLLSAIAEIHGGQTFRASKRLTDTLPSLYQHLIANRPDLKLPSQAQLDDFLKEPTPENAKYLDHPWLEGWIHRLVRCRLWMAEEKHKKSEGVEKAHEWLTSAFGAHFPIELAFGHDVAQKRRLAIIPTGRRVWNFSWPILGCTVIGTIIYVVLSLIAVLILPRVPCLGLLIPVAVLLFLRPVFQWIRDERGTHIGVTIAVGIMMFCFLVALLVTLVTILEGSVAELGLFLSSMAPTAGKYLLPVIALAAVLWGARYLLRKHLGAWHAARADLSLVLVPDSSDGVVTESEDTAQTVAMKLTRLERTFVWLLPLLSHRSAKQEIQERWNIPALASYQKIASDSPFTIAAEFDRLDERLGNRTLPVALRISAPLVGLPWEAFFILARPRTRDLKLQFWRSGVALPPGRLVSNAKGVSVLGNDTWSLMIQNGWEPLTSGPEIRDYSAKLEPDKPRMVLHLIGQPIATSAGLRLMSSKTSTLRPVRNTYAPPPGSTSESIGDNGILLGIDDLPIASAALVVIQAEPISDLMPRLETDRTEAAKLRTFANDAFAAGAQAVLMLPTLPPPIAERVLTILARYLATSATPNLQLLLTAVAEMRASIRDRKIYETPTEREAFTGKNEQLQKELEETRFELALDLCLYARTHPS